MPVDPKKLRQDAARLQKTRQTVLGRRETTGATKAIRAALPTIRQLRKDEVSWAVIAQALAEQGVVQGKDRTPLMPKRLTALVSQIESQARKKALKESNRDRKDTTKRKVEPSPRLTLAPELVGSVKAPDFQPSSTEDELRQAAFQKLKTVLKEE